MFTHYQVLLASLVLWTAGSSLTAVAQEASPLKGRQVAVAKLIENDFSKKANYAPGDFISRGDVEPVFNRLIEAGYKPVNRERLYADFLPDDSFLAASLSRPDGTAFMRKVSDLPGVYDRLERLSRIHAGRDTIADMIRRPDGPELLRTLTTPAGAAVVEKLMQGDAAGQQFELPTGHIHTVSQLLSRIGALYQE